MAGKCRFLKFFTGHHKNCSKLRFWTIFCRVVGWKTPSQICWKINFTGFILGHIPINPHFFFSNSFQIPWNLPLILQDFGRNGISSSYFSNFSPPSLFLTNFWNFEGLLEIQNENSDHSITQITLIWLDSLEILFILSLFSN